MPDAAENNRVQNLLASAARQSHEATCRLQHAHPAIRSRCGATLPCKLTHDAVQAGLAPAAGNALPWVECALPWAQGRATGRRLQNTSKDAPGNLVAFGAPNAVVSRICFCGTRAPKLFSVCLARSFMTSGQVASGPSP